MKLLLRADADTASGQGHVMRCLALGQAWQDMGGTVTLLAARLPESLAARMRAERVDVVDGENTIEIARQIGAGWVVFDGYAFDSACQQRLKDAGLRLLWIDDYGHAPPYSADLVLNQNPSADESLYQERAASTQLLLGPRYALLRREFRKQRAARETAAAARRVLVTMGGGDPENVTGKIIEALRQLDVEAIVVVGSANPHRHQQSETIRIVTNPPDLPELMSWADVAVSAGGSTVWELAYLGIPTVVIPFAENQLPIAQSGVALNLGWHADVVPAQIAGAISGLLRDTERRAAMARNGQRLIDGRGAARVIGAMNGRAVSLRPATQEDSELLWRWVNDPGVRASSFSTEPIPWESHVRWFGARLASDRCRIYIAVAYGQPVGQIRYDLTDDRAVVDVSIDPARRGQGWGNRVIELGSEELFRATGVKEIDAFVKAENTASARAFAAAGFTNRGTTVVDGHPAVHLMMRRSEGR